MTIGNAIKRILQHTCVLAWLLCHLEYAKHTRQMLTPRGTFLSISIPNGCIRRASTKSYETEEAGLHADGGDSQHERADWIDQILPNNIIMDKSVPCSNLTGPLLIPLSVCSSGPGQSQSPRLPITWNS